MIPDMIEKTSSRTQMNVGTSDFCFLVAPVFFLTWLITKDCMCLSVSS
jgi:hypothetical protein